MTDQLWPLMIYAGAVLFIVAGMIGISYLLGERHREPATDEPYESGIVSTGSAEIRIPIQFYLVAMFFVIFDLEAVFIYAWAVAVPEVGWLGFWAMVVFIGILLIALGYLWRIGGLDWGSASRGGPIRQREVRDELVAHQSDGYSSVG